MLKFFLLKLAPHCKLSLVCAAPTILPLLFTSRSVVFTLSSPWSVLRFHTLWHNWWKLSSLLCFCWATIGLWSLIFSDNYMADELARQGVVRLPSAVFCSLSRIHSSHLLHWKHTFLFKFFCHTGFLSFHRRACAFSSRSLRPLSSPSLNSQPVQCRHVAASPPR